MNLISQTSQNLGIIAYGAYIPRYKIFTETMKHAWKNKQDVIAHLKIVSKSVASVYEDTATMAAQAASYAIQQRQLNVNAIDAIFVGSESHPYAVKPTGTLVKTMLGMTNQNVFCSDLEFACKAGTSAIQLIQGLIAMYHIRYGLAIGSDDSQASPDDILDVSAGAGAAAFVLGSESDKLLAKINHTISITSDIPDFWRKEGECFPTHGGRFTGRPAYFATIQTAVSRLIEELGTTPKDYQHVIFHGPNGFFPLAVAKRLGFDPSKLTSLPLIERIGNTYSANSLLSLAYVLDSAEVDDRILLCSYGSGAGADAIDLSVTSELVNINRRVHSLQQQLERQEAISYDRYLIMKNLVRFG